MCVWPRVSHRRVSPGSRPRPSLSVPAGQFYQFIERLVSPGSRPRPSLSVTASGAPLHVVESVAGVSAPAFVERVSMAIENAGELTFSRPLSAVSPVGDAYDNAPCDSFFATLECELIRRRSFRTQSEARRAVFRFIETGTIPIGGIQALATSPRPTSKPGRERRRREDRAMSGPPASAALFHSPIDGAETLDLSEWTSSEKSTTLNWPPKRGKPPRVQVHQDLPAPRGRCAFSRRWSCPL